MTSEWTMLKWSQGYDVPPNQASSTPTACEFGDELLEATVQKRLGNRIRDLRILRSERGVILQGRVPTYYAKQLAQHAILELGELVAANQIEVQ